MSDSSAVNTLSRVLTALLRASSFVELFFGSGGSCVWQGVCGKRGERGGSSVLGVQTDVTE